MAHEWRSCLDCHALLTPENWPPSFQAAHRYLCQPCNRARARRRKAALVQPPTLMEAVAALVAWGMPADHVGRGVQCAYCGVTTEERQAGAPHRNTCVWAALKTVWDGEKLA